MKISVIGTGYVGLVVGTCLAESGNDVICVDNDDSKIAILNNGQIPIFEPGLEELVQRNVGEGRLSFTTDLEYAIKESLVIFIAVGTPQSDIGAVDLSYIHEVAEGIANAINGFKIIVTKSTVPVGTTESVRDIITAKTKHDFTVVSNPEFLKEGAAVDDFMKPDRVIIGTDSSEAAEIMQELYTPFVRTGKPIMFMSIRSAEMSKYASNALLATKISFMNEIANMCDLLGADVNEVRKGVGADSRIGYHFLFPGVGYGGSCFPKDVNALIHTAKKVGYEFKILKSVEDVNERQKSFLISKIKGFFNGDLTKRTFAVWGLSFKPRTDDMRDAPSIVIINKLLDLGAKVKAYDPEATEHARSIFGDAITLTQRNYDALVDADALIVVTEWNEFRRPNFDMMKQLMTKPVVFDGRNIYDAKVLSDKGFTYFGVGT